MSREQGAGTKNESRRRIIRIRSRTINHDLCEVNLGWKLRIRSSTPEDDAIIGTVAGRRNSKRTEVEQIN